MVRKLFSLCPLVLLAMGMYAQQPKGISLDIRTGVETGVWIYNKGSDQEDIYNNLGWDRSYHRPWLFLGGESRYHFRSWRLGMGFDHCLFDAITLLEDSHTPGGDSEYRISNGWVKFNRFYLIAGVDIVRKKNFTLSPEISAGGFGIKTTNPYRGNFGPQVFLRANFLFQFRIFDPFHFYFTPSWTRMLIWPRVKTVFRERHTMQSWGINFGFRFWILRTVQKEASQ